MKKKRKIKELVILLAAAVLAVFCYSRYMEPEMLIVKEIFVETDMDIETCRAVFFTDTHFGELYDEKHVKKIVDMINGREADIVVFGGDLIDNYGRDKEILDMDYLRDALGRIKAKEGKYAVFGNHDYGGGAFSIYEELLAQCGFQVLVNDCVVLEKYKMELIGFDDYLLGQMDSDLCCVQKDRFHLIVAHEPVISGFIEGAGDNFVLAGHTHGGQVSIPYFTKKQIPTGSGAFVKGLYEASDIGAKAPVRMYVSSGIGLTKYPFRFMNVPEIIEINFSKKAS